MMNVSTYLERRSLKNLYQKYFPYTCSSEHKCHELLLTDCQKNKSENCNLSVAIFYSNN